MGLDSTMTFFLASLLLALAPGPDNLFVITHSMLRGKQAGLAVVMGLCSGLLVHTSAVALGLAVIFQTSAWAFFLLKLAGATYLVYLAWRAFTATAVPFSGEENLSEDFRYSYRRGIVMNVTNPKVTLFFLAFLPQFVEPAAGAVSLQVMVLGGVFIAATILVFGSMAILAAKMAGLLKRSGAFQQWLNRLAGTVFLLLAAHLLVM